MSSVNTNYSNISSPVQFPQAPLVSSSQISTIPFDVFGLIFKVLPYETSQIFFSRVCKYFNNVFHTYHRPIDVLFSSRCKTIEFIQNNEILSFTTRPCTPENTQDQVITTDDGEYDANPKVTIWSSGEPPVRETGFYSFFSKPIEYSLKTGTNPPYFVAAQNNGEGKIQVWDLEAKKKLIEEKLNRRITCLSSVGPLLHIGFDNGTLEVFKIDQTLASIASRPAQDNAIKFFFNDLKINREFTLTNSNVKIWDMKSLECVKDLPLENCYLSHSFYNEESQTLGGVTRNKEAGHTIFLWNGVDGKEIGSYVCPKVNGSFTAVHLDSNKELLFGAYLWMDKSNGTSLGRSGIAVWDLKSKQLLKDFPGLVGKKGDVDLHEQFREIDFDSESGLILTGGYGVHLWSLEEGKLFKKLDFPEGRVTQLQWDKANKRIFALIEKTLYLKDYSTRPFQIVKSDNNSSKT